MTKNTGASGDMGLSEDKEIIKQHQDLCKSLNLDKASGSEAWKSFSKVYDSFIFEGEPIQWLGCAIYVACRNSSVPAVGKSSIYVQGNLVNLARLLKQINLSLVEFLVKLKKWADLVQLSDDFLKKLHQLERNFTVSVVIFKQFQPIFADMFSDPALENSKSLKAKKYKAQPATVWRTFEFTWTLFICVKSSYPKISDDLVSSYHLLLACCDFIFINAFLSSRKDLINENFQAFTDIRSVKYADSNEIPCIIDHLCKRHNGVAVEAKTIKEYTFRNHIKMLFERKILKGKTESLTEIFDSNHFENNLKGINRHYEEYVLSAGEFDERIFFGDYKKFRTQGSDDKEKSLIGCSIAGMDSSTIDPADRLTPLGDHSELKPMMKPFCPMTPLTGRMYLSKKESRDSPELTNISSAVALDKFISSREPSPSEYLSGFIKMSQTSLQVESYIENMSRELTSKLALDEKIPAELVREIEILIKKLYYKLLDLILEKEVQKPFFNANQLLGQEIFHQTLFSCASEIVLFSQNVQRPFQWILDLVGIAPYQFYRIIEIVMSTIPPLTSTEPSLTREQVKHLSRIEETILESLAWKRDSPLWKGIIESGKPIPSCEDVTAYSNQDSDSPGSDSSIKSTIRTNSIDKLALLAGRESVLTDSPGGPLSDRFQMSSPLRKRQAIDVPDSPPSKMNKTLSAPLQQKDAVKTTKENRKPKRTGAIALFFRKFYYLASVRMQDMCNLLSLTDVDLRRKIWTCFELSIVHHIGLMYERHLDQILMCSVYVMCRIVGPEKTFTEVMKCYRSQPQAQSSVYRNVLIAPDISVEDLQKNCKATEEERGDLIKFYNSVYVKNVQHLLLPFKDENSDRERVVLSPIPVTRSPTGPKKVTENFALFLRTQGQEAMTESTGTNHISICLNQSPARSKDLQAINKMMKGDRYRANKKILVNNEEDKNKPYCRLISRKLKI